MSEADTITVSGIITFGVQFRATGVFNRRSWVYGAMFAFFVVIPLIALAANFATGRDLSERSLWDLPLWAVFLLGPAFIFLLLPLCRALSLQQARSRNTSIQGVQTTTLSPEGYEVRGSSFEVKLKWESFNKVVETREFIFFYVASQAARFIVKAQVASPEDLRSIRRIVSAALGSKAKMRSS